LAALYTEQTLPDLANEDPEAVRLFQEFMKLTSRKKDAVGAYMVAVPDIEIPGLYEDMPRKPTKFTKKRRQHSDNGRCACCGYGDWVFPTEDTELNQSPTLHSGARVSVFAGKKYKPVADKIKPTFQELPEEYRIIRNITGDPLKDMPELPVFPPEFTPTGRYTKDRRDIVDKLHDEDFLLPWERKLMHYFMMLHEKNFAWEDSERGTFKEEYFPPVKFPVLKGHKVWVERNIPIPPGQLEEVCRVLRASIDSNIYEPSNGAYRTKYFSVLKSDGKSIRLVHSLEPLNAATIAHSGLPPGAEELASHFAGRSCGGCLDLYSGYNHRTIDEASRDYTTFQTPFGALRLVKLPQGWTNSVPIFHDDVTYILRDEVPHVTRPYIDDVPIRGPGTRYEMDDGTEERIPENPGIRRFVWEHFQNLNRIVTRMGYAGGTFSGKKAVLCRSDPTIVGHVCTYEGMKPSVDRIGVIQRWAPCTNYTDVKSFLGTVGVMRRYIEDYTIKAEPINLLTRKGVEFDWGPRQEASMKILKEAVANCPCLKPLNYEWDSDVVLAVDSSWMATGIIVYQVDPKDKTKKYFAKFASLPMNEREANYSQPKRELFGIKRALEAMHFWFDGCRKLVVETDAKYVKGMLDNPGVGPNATINRWIEDILKFHFTLKHVAGKTFSPDGLSRRVAQPGDEVFEDREVDFDNNLPPQLHKDSIETPAPLNFEDFKDDIDTRGGYYFSMSGNEAESYHDLQDELKLAEAGQTCREQEILAPLKQLLQEMPDAHKQMLQDSCLCPGAEKKDQSVSRFFISQLAQGKKKKKAGVSRIVKKDGEPMLPKQNSEVAPEEEELYDESHRTESAIETDLRLELVRVWMKDTLVRPEGMSNKQYTSFMRFAVQFYIDKKGRMYRKSKGGEHKLVVAKENRTYMIRAAHDSLGHRGFYATKSLLELRFWWPEFERDVSHHIKTCLLCQLRQKTLLHIPPVVTHTPSLFQQIHVDVMVMGTPSNGFNKVVDARDSLSRWLEARPIKNETARTLGLFLLEEIICRWGCPEVIVTDNAPQFLAAVAWLKDKYGIQGIRVSPYNSQGNGSVENGHWPMRQSLYKATGGNPGKWYWFFPQVVWADRVTIRRGLGCSPYFMVTGAHPLLPLDIEEATWLVELPDRVLTTEELIGFRAQALAKHRTHVERMRERVTAEKRAAVRRYEKVNEHTIRDFSFLPGDLVLIRNTTVEKSLNTKMEPRYLGPMIVIRRTLGGSYVIAELDGSVFQSKIAQFRVVPYEARKSVPLPPNIHDLIDLSKETLDLLVADGEVDEYKGKDLQFDNVRLGVDDGYEELRPEEVEEEDSGQESDDGAPKIHQTRAVKKVGKALQREQEADLEKAWDTWQRKKLMESDETIAGATIKG
jgi:hypothetical protein